jgi:hypothetical protein
MMPQPAPHRLGNGCSMRWTSQKRDFAKLALGQAPQAATPCPCSYGVRWLCRNVTRISLGFWTGRPQSREGPRQRIFEQVQVVGEAGGQGLLTLHMDGVARRQVSQLALHDRGDRYLPGCAGDRAPSVSR